MNSALHNPEPHGQTWHYPDCEIHNHTDPHDFCVKRMVEQIERLQQEHRIQAIQLRKARSRYDGN